MRATVMPVAIGFVLTIASPALPAIRFDNFDSAPGLSLVGDAAVAGGSLRLTPAIHDRSGAVWLRLKQPVASGFDTTFQFQLTKQGGMGHGADGFAFVVQNSGPDALGGRGSAGGFAVTDPNYQKTETSIPWSIAVFFDTFRNPEAGDPSGNYIAYCTYGRPSESRWPAARLASTSHLSVHLKDGKAHTARILFQPPFLSVFLDGSAKAALEAVVDFSIVVGRDGTAWVGFTASTGGGYQNHDILNWSFAAPNASSSVSTISSDISFPMSACLPDRNLCTPQRAFVVSSEGGYHVVLPANSEWGASIPNPLGREVLITNAHGIACWDATARPQGCSGPSGNGASAGMGFVAPDAPPGALITSNRDDYTWFSVNGRSGAAFKDNEGFYEFDLQLKTPKTDEGHPEAR